MVNIDTFDRRRMLTGMGAVAGSALLGGTAAAASASRPDAALTDPVSGAVDWEAVRGQFRLTPGKVDLNGERHLWSAAPLAMEPVSSDFYSDDTPMRQRCRCVAVDETSGLTSCDVGYGAWPSCRL